MGTKFYYVTRDGVRRSPLFLTDTEQWKFLLHAQNQSNDWAIKYEGWAYAEGELQPWETYGTDDVAQQLEIEAARIDAAWLRAKTKDRGDRVREANPGANAEDISAVVEHTD